MIPPNAADGATWLTVTSWQGGGLTVNRLKEIRPGVYQSTEPIPIHGDWKTLIRMHTRQLDHGPADLRARRRRRSRRREVPAPRAFVRPFVSDHKLLQREAKTNDPGDHRGAYGDHRVLHVRCCSRCWPGGCIASA